MTKTKCMICKASCYSDEIFSAEYDAIKVCYGCADELGNSWAAIQKTVRDLKVIGPWT